MVKFVLYDLYAFSLEELGLDISLNQPFTCELGDILYFIIGQSSIIYPFFHLFCVKIILEGDKDKYVIFWEITATTRNAFKDELGKINWVEITWLK